MITTINEFRKYLESSNYGKKINETVERLNTEKLVALLSTVNNATPATITYVSTVAMNKFFKDNEGNKILNPYHNRVTKEQISNVFLGIKYENAVNKRREKTGLDKNFVAKANKQGIKNENSILILGTDGTYKVMTYFITNSKPKVKYFVDGVETDKSEFSQYMKPYIPSNEEGNNPVIVRSFKLGSIKAIKIHGNEYINSDMVTENIS